jgi:uncharacterized protein
MMRPGAGYWIEKLSLELHIEGGSYRRTYAASLSLSKNQLPVSFHGDRPVATSIYFLLEQHQFSAMHRIASDELWHFYYGDPLIVYEINTNGALIKHILGNNPDNGEQFQCVVRAGSWFGSKIKDGGEYALTGCTVSPGFDFTDFELGRRNELVSLFPQHRETIIMLTH